MARQPSLARVTLANTYPDFTGDPNIIAFFDADLGRTDVVAAVTDANDISTANWTPQSVANRTATSFTDTVDGAPTIHMVYQSVANVQTGHLATLTLTILPASTQHVGIFFDAGAAQATLDRIAGTITFSAGWTVAPTYNATTGVFTGGRMVVTSGQVRITTASAPGTWSYQGTGSITAAATAISVTQINCSAWADQKGSNGAAIVDGSDLSTASWTPSPAGVGHTVTTITDTVDGGPTAHFVYSTSTQPGCNLGRPATLSMTVIPTATRYVYISFDNTTAFAILDTQGAGAITSQGNWNSTATYVGGVFTGTRTLVTNSRIYLYTCNGPAGGDVTYTGDGLHTAAFTNISITQSIAITQSTAANRPGVVQVASPLYGSMIPALYGDGINDYLQGLIAGLAQPVTVFLWGYWSDAYSVVEYIMDGATGNKMALYRSSAISGIAYSGAPGMQMVGTLLTQTVGHCYGIVFNGTSSVAYRDGVAINTTSDCGAGPSTGLTLFAAATPTAYSKAYIFAVAIYRGVANATAIQRAYQYGQKRGWTL